jgi:hypothetical protein
MSSAYKLMTATGLTTCKNVTSDFEVVHTVHFPLERIYSTNKHT